MNVAMADVGSAPAVRVDDDVTPLEESPLTRDDTQRTVLTIAETGRLVVSTLHTNDAAQALDRVVDVFSGDQQNQIRTQIATGSAYRLSTLESSLAELVNLGIISYEEALNHSLYPKELDNSSVTRTPRVVAPA